MKYIKEYTKLYENIDFDEDDFDWIEEEPININKPLSDINLYLDNKYLDYKILEGKKVRLSSTSDYYYQCFHNGKPANGTIIGMVVGYNNWTIVKWDNKSEKRAYPNKELYLLEQI